MCKTCCRCGASLVVGENWYKSFEHRKIHVCIPCKKVYDHEYKRTHKDLINNTRRERTHRMGIHEPMDKNRSCSFFLGVHVAERVLFNVFRNVEKMHIHNRGYDFVCNHGKFVDVKASCEHTYGGRSHWVFAIRNNRVADYFLCIAFDDRTSLNPLHIWLLPGKIVNHKHSATISKSTLGKWDEYKLNIGKVVDCCEAMR